MWWVWEDVLPPKHTVFVLGKQGKGAEWKKQSFSSLASAVYNRLA